MHVLVVHDGDDALHVSMLPMHTCKQGERDWSRRANLYSTAIGIRPSTRQEDGLSQIFEYLSKSTMIMSVIVFKKRYRSYGAAESSLSDSFLPLRLIVSH
jgi:hypothetical protein